MLQSQAFPELKSQQTLQIITSGRLSGLPHIAELRFTYLDGSFFVLAGNAQSDWVLNALSSGHVRVKIGEAVYDGVTVHVTMAERPRTLQSFQKKYGSPIVDKWYSNAQLCLRLGTVGPPSTSGAVRGETQTLTNFSQWKTRGAEYYQSVEEAFGSASEEYDYTISRNYINTWIRKRSISELVRLTKPTDVLLEIGCGTGTEAIQISRHVAGIIATDISDKMLSLLQRKLLTKRLDRKILTARLRASAAANAAKLLPQGKVRIAYSFNGALNCEPELNKVPEQLSKIIDSEGYFVCSIRNTLCLPEALTHLPSFQLDKLTSRKTQPTMVSVGGIDIPSYYYSPAAFARFFLPYFRTKKVIGLPAFLPPAYLNDYYLRTGIAGLFLEKLEFVLGDRFPFNRLGDQTLFVFQKA